MEPGKKKENCEVKINNIKKEDSKKSSKIDNILKNNEIDFEDENEYKEIKDELERYKKEKEKEVEDLEKELNQLKQENAKYEEDVNDENNNILLNEQTIEKLKSDIIKDIESKIGKTIQDKIQDKVDKELENIKANNNRYIDTKYSNTINVEVNKWREKILKDIKNQSQFMNNNSDNKKQNENDDKSKVKGKNINNEHKLEKSIANIQTIKNHENSKNDNSFNKAQKNTHLNNKNKNNNDISNKLNLNYNYKPEQPIKPNNNIINKNSCEQENPLKQLKKNIYNELFIIFNNIFFKNKEQTSIKAEKINELQREKLANKYFNFQKLKLEYVLTTYFDNFLKVNVFKIFQKRNIDEHITENLRYNIETILDIFQTDKYRYKNYYYPNNKTGIKDRKKSVEAARKFRETFNIDESIIKEEELIKKLDQNDNDINKVMQQIFG